MASDNRADGGTDRQSRQQPPPDDEVESTGPRRRPLGERLSGWFATAAVQIGLTLIGLVVLLFALGQAMDVDLLRMVTDALTTQTGRWLVVAFFAVLLIIAAQRGISYRS